MQREQEREKEINERREIAREAEEKRRKRSSS
jgi:hypothetical protein